MRFRLPPCAARDNFSLPDKALIMAQNDNQINWSEQTDYLRELSLLVQQEGLSELKIESGGVRFRLRGDSFQVASEPTETVRVVSPAPTAAAIAPATPAPASEKLTPIVSPMVGVFYRAPSPGEPNFCEIGDQIEVGQTVGIIEAMKVFNEIVAETEGTVAQIPAENSELVETGAPLILLRK